MLALLKNYLIETIFIYLIFIVKCFHFTATNKQSNYYIDYFFPTMNLKTKIYYKQKHHCKFLSILNPKFPFHLVLYHRTLNLQMHC